MYLGLDLGTSGVKAMLIDGDQKIVGSANGSLDVSRPHSGWSEQEPAHWVRATEEAIAGLKAKHPKEFAAVRGSVTTWTPMTWSPSRLATIPEMPAPMSPPCTP